MYGPQVQSSFVFAFGLLVYYLFLTTATTTSNLLSRLTTADIIDTEKQASGLEIMLAV